MLLGDNSKAAVDVKFHTGKQLPTITGVTISFASTPCLAMANTLGCDVTIGLKGKITINRMM